VGDQGGAVGRSGEHAEPRDLDLHRAFRHAGTECDLSRRQSHGERANDLALPPGERVLGRRGPLEQHADREPAHDGTTEQHGRPFHGGSNGPGLR
jgi:hypothetical protein